MRHTTTMTTKFMNGFTSPRVAALASFAPVVLWAGVLTCLGVAGEALALPSAHAAAAVSQDETQDYAAVVTGDDLYVRSGAGNTYYAFGKLHEGDVVNVVGERFGWARITTSGHAFRDLFGYVKEGDVQVADDGVTATTLGKVEVFAPHMDRNYAPDSSWKWIARLDPESELTVLERIKGEKEAFLKVRLPESGTGWVSASFLRRATPEEIRAWERLTASADAETTTDNADAATDATPPDVKASNDDSATENDATTTTPDAASNNEGDDVTPVNENETLNGEASNASTPAGEEAIDTPTGGEAGEPVDATTQEPLATNEESITMPLTSGAETEAEAAPAPSPRTLAQVTFNDLEAAYEALKQEPIRDAEIEPLRQRYLALIEADGADSTHVNAAKSRLKLLDVRLEVQEKMLELDRIRQRADMTTEDAQAARTALELAANYTAVGRVGASTIYDGTRLPQLLRLTDVATGRTIAYLEPGGEHDLLGLIGQLIGVVGEKEYDGGLRLTVIRPSRIDILTTTSRN